MSKLKKTARLITLLVTLFLLPSPLMAQQKRAQTPKKPAGAQAPEPVPKFDNLIAADSYRIYGEIRGVGGLIRSPAISDLLDPVMKLAAPPKGFKSIVNWLNAHAEALAGSRMLVAGWPSRPKLPNILIAIEFSSPEEAQKFEPELRGFVPTLLPKPSPTPTPSSPNPEKPNSPAMPVAQSQGAALPPYRISQSGSLVLLSDQAFEFRNLTPRGSKLLGEDQDFAMARNRFASEPIFLFVDVKSIEKEEQERRKRYEEEEQKRIETEAANPPKEEPTPDNVDSQMVEAVVEGSPSASTEPAPMNSEQATLGTSSPNPQSSSGATLRAIPMRGPDPVDAAFMSLYGALFGGQPKWPEAIGAAVAFDGDGYVVRTLIVNSVENKNNAIPFVPQFISGPPLLPASPNIFPADANLFVAVSLDYAQIYEGTLKAIADGQESAKKYNRQAAGETPQSPLAVFEKKLGLKIKDDVLPLFGNEIALVLLKPRAGTAAASPAAEQPTPEKSEQKPAGPPEPIPVVAISIKDQDAVKRLIPKLIEASGFKGANLLAQSEKRDDTEIISYANLFAYAFIGDFLVLSADAAATRQVVDFYLSHQTLSSDSHFRNSSRWQPRQVLGQVFVAPSLIDLYYPAGGTGAPVNDKMREFLSGMSPVIEPLTYALSNEGMGPLHELHVPRNLLMLAVAGISSEASESPLITNEAIAKSLMRTVVSAEATFQATKGDGHYGSLDELLSEGLINKDVLEKYGYKIDVTVSSNKFEATAIPREYGKTGRLSYFVDESGVLRAGDHGGGPATISDKPAE